MAFTGFWFPTGRLMWVSFHTRLRVHEDLDVNEHYSHPQPSPSASKPYSS